MPIKLQKSFKRLARKRLVYLSKREREKLRQIDFRLRLGGSYIPKDMVILAFPNYKSSSKEDGGSSFLGYLVTVGGKGIPDLRWRKMRGRPYSSSIQDPRPD